jgi:hypothetical protein
MTEPLTDAQLAEIEARANAASKGPWMSKPSNLGTKNFQFDIWDANGIMVGMTWHYMRPEDNRDFIEHSRTDIPRLLAEVRRLRANQPHPLAVSQTPDTPRGGCGMRYHHESCDCGGMGGNR